MVIKKSILIILGMLLVIWGTVVIHDTYIQKRSVTYMLKSGVNQVPETILKEQSVAAYKELLVQLGIVILGTGLVLFPIISSRKTSKRNNVDISILFDKLEQLRSQFESNDIGFCADVKLQIESRSFLKSIWSEPHELGELIIFMFLEKGLICDKSCCLGLIKGKNGETTKLTQEQLWDIGIP